MMRNLADVLPVFHLSSLVALIGKPFALACPYPRSVLIPAIYRLVFKVRQTGSAASGALTEY